MVLKSVFSSFVVGANGSLSKDNDPEMVRVQEINTLAKGKCRLLTPLVQAGHLYPALILTMTTPPNE